MRILVTGANGMLGKAVVDAISIIHDVVPITRKDGDLRNPTAVDQIIYLHQPEVVINCAGELPGANAEALFVNVAGPMNLSLACRSVGARFVHVSTDCVFSGNIPEGMKYYPNTNTDPLDNYGLSKARGEKIPYGTVVRTSFIGPDHGFLAWVLKEYDKQEYLQGYAKAFWTGSTVWEVARSLLEIAENVYASPVIHLSTFSVTSKFDLMMHIRKIFDLRFPIEPVEEPYINRALEPSWLLQSVFNDQISDELVNKS